MEISLNGDNIMFKKIGLFCTALLINLFWTTAVFGYEVQLTGGSEIKEAAVIISTLVTIESLKIFMIILLGFLCAFQGLRLIINGLCSFIDKEGSRKSLLLCLVGILFIGCGVTIIFKDELIKQVLPRSTTKPKAEQYKLDEMPAQVEQKTEQQVEQKTEQNS